MLSIVSLFKFSSSSKADFSPSAFFFLAAATFTSASAFVCVAAWTSSSAFEISSLISSFIIMSFAYLFIAIAWSLFMPFNSSGNEIPYLLLNLFLCHSGVCTGSLAPFTLLNTLLILPAIPSGAISCLTSVLNIGASLNNSLSVISLPNAFSNALIISTSVEAPRLSCLTILTNSFSEKS